MGNGTSLVWDGSLLELSQFQIRRWNCPNHLQEKADPRLPQRFTSLLDPGSTVGPYDGRVDGSRIGSTPHGGRRRLQQRPRCRWRSALRPEACGSGNTRCAVAHLNFAGQPARPHDHPSFVPAVGACVLKAVVAKIQTTEFLKAQASHHRYFHSSDRP